MSLQAPRGFSVLSSNTYKYPKFTTVKFKATHDFSTLLKNQIQLNFTQIRFNFSLNTNPKSL